MKFRSATLLLWLPASGLSHAQTTVLKIDYATVNIPGNTQIGLTAPYVQNGLRLSAKDSGNNNQTLNIQGANSPHYVGLRSMHPSYPGSAVTVTLDMPNGRRFSLKSIRLHPATVGFPVQVNILGFEGNGSIWSGGGSTGSALAGNVITFDSHWQNLSHATWTTGPIGGSGSNINYHEVSEIVAELVPIFAIPAAVTVNEAAGTALLPVSLTSPWSSNLTLNYAVNAGSATSGADYHPPASGATGTLSIPAGSTTVPLTIPLQNDTAMESPETLTVVFSNAPFGFFLPGNGATFTSTVAIASDDGVANFAGWMSAHDLTGTNALASADPNHDHVDNAESWLLRLNPAGPNPESWLNRRAVWLATAANRPALGLTVPLPLPSDVRIIFEECTDPATWSEQARRSGFATGSLWTGSGASRITESNTLSARTITFPGSQTIAARSRAFLRLKYEIFNSGGSD